MEFTVKRSRWGHGDEKGFLLRGYDNKMCCLGFVCRQVGLKRNQILDKIMPDELIPVLRDKLIGALTFKRGQDVKDYRWLNEAARINDSQTYTPKETERKLKSIFSKNGHTLKFID